MKTRGTLITLIAVAIIITVASLGHGSASASTRLYPATSAWPTAGICAGGATGRVVTVKLYDDMSQFRCYEVTKSQHLRFVNRGTHTMRLRAPFLHVTLRPGQAWKIPGRVGSYLAPGDHSVGSTAWCCFGFDIFLPGAPQPVPTGGAG